MNDTTEKVISKTLALAKSQHQNYRHSSKSELKRLCAQDPVGMAKKILELEQRVEAAEAREAELREKLEATELELMAEQTVAEAMTKRAEAAEARIKASQEQDPVGFIDENALRDLGRGYSATLNRLLMTAFSQCMPTHNSARTSRATARERRTPQAARRSKE